MAVVTLGICQGQKKTANTPLTHKSIQDMRVGIGGMAEQELILMYMPNA
jgi:hypothetical protein